MKTAQQWLDEIQEDQMAACVHYEIHKQMGPSVSMLDWIEMIQHDAQDDFTNQVAELKSLVDAGMHESADLCNRLAEAKAENARLRDLLEPVQPRRKWRPIPRVSYTNFCKLYPQSQGFKRWIVAERFWRKRLWVIGIRHHIVKIDWRRDWVRDMFESELDLESLIPKSQHNDILDMVRRTEVEPLKAENARLEGLVQFILNKEAEGYVSFLGCPWRVKLETELARLRVAREGGK